ncbi:glycosyltransferase [Plesiomonas sp.]|uniref:glycosyltransferase n=1 Tax=Plesiomonas sp. TaxID=2486279 RepID=UPI003F340CA1
MLILANTLAFNGGTTFILRFCKERLRRGKKVGVLCMTGNEKTPLPLHHEISKYADIYYINDNTSSLLTKFLCKTPLVGFLPVDFDKIDRIVQKHGNNVHVMGTLGLLFIARYIGKIKNTIKLSIGVYHQNEFMFKSSRLFARHAFDLFQSVGGDGVIFFNEENMNSYSRFYNVNYNNSSISPIGIELPMNDVGVLGGYNYNRIVSVGNLVNFKTYNSHIIKLLPSLLQINPNLCYEIYGDGPYKQQLMRLAKDVGVQDKVIFNGAIEYSKFATAVNKSALFVGSGTALIEAAALGIPALIGIESTKEPITYGFLNEIIGYSYNEYSSERCVYNMYDRILSLITDTTHWNNTSIACRHKAIEFSINTTVDIFENNFLKPSSINPMVINKHSNNRLLFSFLICVFLHLINVDKSFSNRRDQGSVV